MKNTSYTSSFLVEPSLTNGEFIVYLRSVNVKQLSYDHNDKEVTSSKRRLFEGSLVECQAYVDLASKGLIDFTNRKEILKGKTNR